MNTALMAHALAAASVHWDKKKGALCPICSRRMRVGTKQGKVRFCYCRNKACAVCVMKIGVKVVEG